MQLLSREIIFDMLQQSLEICTSCGDQHMQVDVLQALGKLHLHFDDRDAARDSLEQAKLLAEEICSETQLSSVCTAIATLANLKGEYARAYANLLKATQLNEKLKGIEVAQKMQAITMPLELRAAHAEAEVLKLRNRELETQSYHDFLTGLANRRYLEIKMEAFWAAGEHALLILDIDYFKLINDKYTHQVGDKVLKECARILLDVCTEGAIAARFGGEEFVLMLPGIGLEAAKYFAEEVRLAFERYSWGKIAGGLSVSVSGGVAHSDEEENPHAMLQLADSRLYRAKRSGRNRIVPAPNINK
jgi:diguanylate cyclase (GGDEF)-like protein